MTRFSGFIPMGLSALALTGGLLVGCAASGQTLRSADTAVATPTTQSATAPAPVSARMPPAVVGTGASSPGRGVVAPAQPAVGAPAAVAASGAAIAQPATIPPVPTPDVNVVHGIIVSGTGQATGQPDEAILSAGVQTRAATAQDAQAQNNQTMTTVINAIKALGIPDKDVQTTGVSVYPIYTQGDFVSGYSASNNVTVTVENVSQAGAVLDAATKAGANVESGLRFTMKDSSALRNQALAAAAADAKSKANALATALGLQITGIQSVAEASVSSPIIRGPQPLAAAAAGAPSVPVESGQLQVTAQVTIVFSY
jgi:uncharacterized protein YggE